MPRMMGMIGLDERHFAVDDELQVLVIGQRWGKVDDQLELGAERMELAMLNEAP